MHPFDTLHPPRSGRHLIEASAGTGKTYTLMSLAVRAIALDGLAVQALMLTTFTRASTRELRARLRARLKLELSELANPAGFLRQADPDCDLEAVTRRIQHALTHIDEIAITTIHGFANQVITELGPLTGVHPAAVVDDLGIVSEAAARDCFRHILQTADPHWVRRCLGSMSKFVAEIDQLRHHRHARFEPVPSFHIDPNQLRIEREARVQAAQRIRAAFAHIPDRQGALRRHLDSLEAACLAGEAPNGTAIKYLGTKYKESPDLPWVVYLSLCECNTPSEAAFKAAAVQLYFETLTAALHKHQLRHPDALVDDALSICQELSADQVAQSRFGTHQFIAIDEFQDTDRVQWELLDRIYPKCADRLLVLIGDPKQTIYRFRGADTSQYIRIRDELPECHRWTLNQVYRSSATVVDALNSLYRDQPIFGPGLTMPELKAGRPDQTPPLQLDSQPLAGFQWLDNGSPELIAATAASLIALGESGRLTLFDAVENAWVGVEAKHLCVLVRSRSVANDVKQAGQTWGVPMYFSDPTSVFLRPIVRDLGTLVGAIAEPYRTSALTEFLATRWMHLEFTAKPLVERPEFQALQRLCLNANHQWYRIGPARALREVIVQLGLHHVDSSGLDGLTQLTDVSQALELFGEHGKGLTPYETVRWWRQQTQQHDRASESAPRAPTDNALVLINTMHGAKGLEYPIVLVTGDLVPKFKPTSVGYAVDWVDDSGPVLDFAHSEPGLRRKQTEETQENHRLTYVALTRAKYAVFLGQSEQGAIHHLRTAAQSIQQCPHHADWTESPCKPTASLIVKKIPGPRLRNVIPPDWFQTSFTQLSHATGHDQPSMRAEDEPDDFGLTEDVTERSIEPSSWHQIPGGKQTGNLIHALLERTFQKQLNPNDRARERTLLWPAELPIRYQAGIDHWLDAILEHDIGGGSLNALAPSDRVAEPKFLLGLRPGLTLHTLTSGLSTISWMPPLSLGPDRPLARQLSGFMDLIYFRNGRFHVMDYKTNTLGYDDDAYHADALTQAMHDNGYFMQGALYALALHQWLTLRLNDYDPATHLGTVQYLFCRGLNGPARGLWEQPIPIAEIVQLSQEWIHVNRA